jgi:hypothetical protein
MNAMSDVKRITHPVKRQGKILKYILEVTIEVSYS